MFYIDIKIYNLLFILVSIIWTEYNHLYIIYQYSDGSNNRNRNRG